MISYEHLVNTAKPLTAAEIPYMNNWLTIHHELAVADVDLVQSMLVYEMHNKRRSQVITRLATRYITLAKEELHEDLRKYIRQA